jgi:vacuolar-type H+-ATPase subunit H
MSRNYYEHTDAYRNYDARDEDRSVLSNPVPLALIGLGVGWLVWSNTSHPGVDARLRDASRRARQYGGQALHRAEEFRDEALNRASELRDQVSNRASELGDEASSRANEWRDRASSATQSVRDRVQNQTGGQRQDFGSYQGGRSSYGDRARD